jgi:hypothetical protein
LAGSGLGEVVAELAAVRGGSASAGSRITPYY